jgi:methyl-accepting chemotaxis protein
MDKTTQQNATMVNESAQSASQLNDQAAELVYSVSTFKLADVSSDRR